MTTFCLIQIRCRNNHRHPIVSESGQRVPKFTTRNRINTSRRFIQKQDSWFRYQRTSEGQLLFHTTAQTSCEAIQEPFHPKHLEVVCATLFDLLVCKQPEL